MNRKEIAKMMEKRPIVLESETTFEKWAISICLLVGFVLLCLV